MTNKAANAELAAFMAELNAEFGKGSKVKKEPGAKDLNKAFHQQNPTVSAALGKSPERLNPEDSAAWRPLARITHIVRQDCRTCAGVTDFIGGEFIKFRSVQRFGGEILRRSEHCPNLWLFSDDNEPLPDLIEYHSQTVERCPGCIAVEQQALDIILKAEDSQVPELPEMPTQVWRAPEVEASTDVSNREEVRVQRRKQQALWIAQIRQQQDQLELDAPSGD